MSYSYRILEAAAMELLEAAVWYNDKRSGLGDELILSFEATVGSILRNPFTYQARHKQLRIANIQRFPYQVVYFVEDDLITITAFFHGNRHPKTWKTRKPK